MPAGTTCCGMAGDRGLLHPGAAALGAARRRGRARRAQAADACLCSNRTCEIGLQEVTGRPYESFVLALERATRP